MKPLLKVHSFKYEKNHREYRKMIKQKPKAPNKNLKSPVNNLFFIFSGIDKITASWVCLSLENGGIEVAQPCEV